MALMPVASRQIKAVGYDAATRRMVVEFIVKNGRSVYSYEGVPPHVAAHIAFAESVGKAFGATLKADPTAYPFQKTTTPEDYPVAIKDERLDWAEDLRAYLPEVEA